MSGSRRHNPGWLVPTAQVILSAAGLADGAVKLAEHWSSRRANPRLVLELVKRGDHLEIRAPGKGVIGRLKSDDEKLAVKSLEGNGVLVVRTVAHD